MQDNPRGSAITSSRSSRRDAPNASLTGITDSIGVPAGLADLPPLRYYAEYGRRYEARDLDAFIELFDERWMMTDHRTVGWESTLGRDACRALTASVFAVSPGVRFAVDEVIACNERVVAMRASYHGQGAGGHGRFAVEAGFVTLVENGHSLSVDQYEYDDDVAMLARYTELTRG